jgi:Mitochondrial ribosomal protein L31
MCWHRFVSERIRIAPARTKHFRVFLLERMFFTSINLGGLVWKKRFRLTPSQKYRHRKRLQSVDTLLDVLQESKVRLRALVILEVNKRMNSVLLQENQK